MGNQALLRRLEELEAHARLLVASIYTLRLEMEPAVTEPETDSAGNCLHPSNQRDSIPSMGHPARFRCTRCGAIGGMREKP